jgi:hypothetical protein
MAALFASGWMFLAVCLCVILLIFLSIYFVISWSEKRRSGKFSKIARQLGWSFLPRPSKKDVENLKMPSIGPVTHVDRFNNLMNGEYKGYIVEVYDVFCYGSSLDLTDRLTIVQFNLKTQMPVFTINRRTIFSFFGYMTSTHEITFPSNSIFSRRYRVWSKNESELRDILNSETIGFIEQMAPFRRMHVEGNTVTVYYSRGHLKLKNFKKIVDSVAAILKKMQM